MKRGTPSHPKLLELGDALGLQDRRLTIATVELLVHFTREYAIQGDVGRWSDARIAGSLLWPDDPETLITALLQTRWLDSDSRHRLVTHDWPDHADESTKKVLKNRGLEFIRADGLPYSGPPAGIIRNGSSQPDGTVPASRARVRARGSGQVRSGQVRSNQARSLTLSSPNGNERNGDGFAHFWKRYPNHHAKHEALKAWNKLKPDATVVARIHAALDWQLKDPEWTKDNGQYVPYAQKYLNKRRWEDEPSSVLPALSDEMAATVREVFKA